MLEATTLDEAILSYDSASAVAILVKLPNALTVVVEHSWLLTIRDNNISSSTDVRLVVSFINVECAINYSVVGVCVPALTLLKLVIREHTLILGAVITELKSILTNWNTIK